MNWFNKLKSGIQTLVRRRMPDRVWVKCERCEQIIYQKQLEKNTGICPHCKHHVRISSAEYIAAVLDKGSFEEIGREVKSTDPLAFVDLKPYPERLKEYRKRVQMDAAVLAGTGKIDKMRVGIAVHEIGFIGGSLGSAEGERICRVIERCMRDQLPLIIVSRSGGARMQESVLSLMQMAKVNAALSQFSAEGLAVYFRADRSDNGRGGRQLCVHWRCQYRRAKRADRIYGTAHYRVVCQCRRDGSPAPSPARRTSARTRVCRYDRFPQSDESHLVAIDRNAGITAKRIRIRTHKKDEKIKT